MGNYNIAVLKGDGIGPEIVEQGINLFKAISNKYGVTFNFEFGLIGGESIDEYGVPLTDETVKICKEAEAVLLGAVGGPRWDNVPVGLRPEKGLLRIREELEVFANIRPAKIYNALSKASPLKEEVVEKGVDIVIVRELTGGIYFGKKGSYLRADGTRYAFDTEEYSQEEIERIAKIAFTMAGKRNKKVTSVDKANVLESSRLWRECVGEMHKQYPETELKHMYVDNAAMQIIKDPGEFDVILTNNIFGDILSDEASVITGSIGMLPSASLGEGAIGIFEPIHGSAPDIAGKNIANPIATMLSIAMMMKYSFNRDDICDDIYRAVEGVLEEGVRTPDLIRGLNSITVGTAQMGYEICRILCHGDV